MSNSSGAEYNMTGAVNRIEEYLRQLVEYKTISGNTAENDAALDYIESFLVEHGLHVMRMQYNGYGALLATSKGQGKSPRVMLGAHLDVVPAPDGMFGLRRRDGKYFGRGVFDMKFAIAAYMQLVEELDAANALERFDFGIMITTDEEVGGANGVKKIIELGWRPAVCILPDAGPEWQIETLAKGFLYVSLEVPGKTGHGSRPWEADSATFKLIDLLAEFKTLFEGHGPDTNTLNVSMMAGGGKAFTQIPDLARAGLDIRLTSKREFERIRAKLDALCKKHGATYSEEIVGAPCVTSLDDPLVKPFAEIMSEETGVAANGATSYGATDARYFAEIGTPCIVTRPPAGGHHADNEWISCEGVTTFLTILRRYLVRVAR